MTFLLKSLVHLYQWCLSPLLGGQCRFHPTCSHYALDALATHVWPRALKLIVIRIGKCHPWHEGGVDFVPTRAQQSDLGGSS